MAFPDIHACPVGQPNPYERNMGVVIKELLRLFHDHVPDTENATAVLELASTQQHWSAAHGVFDEIRTRLNAASTANDETRAMQYVFEELCCKAMYNATDANDPFAPSAPFFVACAAIRLAQSVGLPTDSVVAVLASKL